MMLTPQFFAGNRKKLLSVLSDNSLLVITANGLLQRSGDTVFPFRQDSNFFYLTGVDEPDVVLVVTGEEELLILPKRTEAERIFGGSINRDEIAKVSGIEKIYEHHNGWNRLKQLQQNRKTVYTCLPAPTKVSGADSFYTNPARKKLIEKLKRMDSKLPIQDIRKELVELRQIKQPAEIEIIKRAIKITKQGFEVARTAIKTDVFENEVESVFDQVFKTSQASHGYLPIIASGKNSCVLHYVKNNQTIAEGELVLFDVGAEYKNYSADISRTYNISSDRQRAVFEAVLRVQQAAIKKLKPGVKWKQFAREVEQMIGEELIQLNLITEPTTEEVRKYFPHSFGHSLGLDVHDPCDYDIIQENMVITVEPGIYIPEEGIGVRIEDNILITKDGAVNLSADIPY